LRTSPTRAQSEYADKARENESHDADEAYVVPFRHIPPFMLFCAALSIEKAIDLPKKEPLVGRYIIPSETAKRKRENSWRDRYQKKSIILRPK
jgi:hypothetical protein